MELKAYQQGVLSDTRDYFEVLAREQRGGNQRYASLVAWEETGHRINYRIRKAGNGKDLPNFCIKVPTGGGKTLLATQILGLAYRTILTARNGAGLVLWVVPSDQIYKDTLKALRDRSHFYRESLEHAVSRKVEVWERQDVANLTPSKLASCLNILIVKLPGTNRQDKESLKFFRDSGGNIVQHFPEENDSEAHRILNQSVSNLDMLVNNQETGQYITKTSVGNLVRLCEPIVVLDEGHKATSRLARETIEGFNPSLVIELSATPQPEANILCRVTGIELLNEQMIKLPINVLNSRHLSWKNCLTQAKQQRDALAEQAVDYYNAGGELIRPMALVQVERTGKDKRSDEYIHSEDVRDYLTQRLGVPKDSVRVKSSVTDDIEGIDLMDVDCPVEWVITKSALQEGWDCPFAYILVSLSNSQSVQAMTQLVGRVLRQPYVKRTPFQSLNESYVFCLREQTNTVVDEIRRALVKEGYEGDLASVVDRADESNIQPSTRTASIRSEFSRLYGKPFEGQIYLPQFCVKASDNVCAEPEPLDYYRHLLSEVDISSFNFDLVASWDFTRDLRDVKENFVRINIGEDILPAFDFRETDRARVDGADETRAWLVANLGLEWFSAKQLRYIVNRACERIVGIENELALIRFSLLDKLTGFIQEQTDLHTEAVFERLYREQRIEFFLTCKECAFQIPSKVERRRIRPLEHLDFTGVQRTLFDFEPDDENSYEKKVALFIDRQPEVLWWYRNIAAPGEFDIQGPRRNRIRPDFVVARQPDRLAQQSTTLVVESKGKQLKGSADTVYKRNVAVYFSRVGANVRWQEMKSWAELGEGFDKHCFRFQILDEGDYPGDTWKDTLNGLLA